MILFAMYKYGFVIFYLFENFILLTTNKLQANVVNHFQISLRFYCVLLYW